MLLSDRTAHATNTYWYPAKWVSLLLFNYVKLYWNSTAVSTTDKWKQYACIKFHRKLDKSAIKNPHNALLFARINTGFLISVVVVSTSVRRPIKCWFKVSVNSKQSAARCKKIWKLIYCRLSLKKLSAQLHDWRVMEHVRSCIKSIW